MKKFTKDIRFLVAVFMLAFVVFGGLAINVVVFGGSSLPVYGGTPPEAFATAFYFKAPVLRLNANSNPNTSFLVVTNEDAIMGRRVFGTAVTINPTGPFTINVQHPGQAQIHLSARMRNGEIKTITCTVIVTGEAPTSTPGGNDDDNDEPIQITAELVPVFEEDDEISFGLVVDGKEVFLFELAAVVIEGDIIVGIFANVATITFTSGNPNFHIRFTASIDGEVVATRYVKK